MSSIPTSSTLQTYRDGEYDEERNTEEDGPDAIDQDAIASNNNNSNEEYEVETDQNLYTGPYINSSEELNVISETSGVDNNCNESEIIEDIQEEFEDLYPIIPQWFKNNHVISSYARNWYQQNKKIL